MLVFVRIIVYLLEPSGFQNIANYVLAYADLVYTLVI